MFLGNLVYANLMGKPVFVIGDREVAEELLNVRGKISASRPPNVLALELCVALPTPKFVTNRHVLARMGWGEWNLSLIPQGKVLSDGRVLMRKATSREAIDSYRPLIEKYNRLSLRSLLGMVGDPSPLVNQYFTFALFDFHR